MDKLEKARTVLQDVVNGSYTVKLLIIMQKPTAELLNLAESAKVEVCQFSEVEDLGKEQPQDAVVSWERLKIELLSFFVFNQIFLDLQ